MLLADTNKGATGFHTRTGPNVSSERSVCPSFGPLYERSVLQSVTSVRTTWTRQSVKGKGKGHPRTGYESPEGE